MKRNPWFALVVGMLGSVALLASISVLGAGDGKPFGQSSAIRPLTAMALNAAAWFDGPTQYSTISNCASIAQGFAYQENGAGTYVGFMAEPGAGLPGPNVTYYVRVVISGLGNACGGTRAYVDLALPASTSLAIDAGHPVYCFADGVPIAPASGCPQSLPASAVNPGGYAIPSGDAAHANTWSIQQGHTLEIQVPVRSSAVLSNSVLQANVSIQDGNGNPWLRPQRGVHVFGSLPAVIYPSPATTALTATSAHTQAYLYAYGNAGTGHFDLGTTTGYGLAHVPVAIPPGEAAWLVYVDWGAPMAPDTLYHWRFTFTTGGGQTYYGADQTFRTLPDGQVTVGNGLAAGCTESAFNTALATAKKIVFDCGLLPVTITLASAHSIASNLVVDGGNKVTLAANGAANHFDVQAGAHLTLAKIALGDGINTAGCGGSVHVLAGGQLTATEARFINNRTNAQGGAVCNHGAADISASFFLNNSATFSHGGAIGSYGSLGIANSKFMGNASAANGGGIDMGGTAAVTESIFLGNAAGLSGGGINTYGGNLTVAGSSFTGNTAAVWGGGLASDASVTTVTGSTFSGNTSTNVGGGLETSGAGSLNLINSTVSGNHAGTDGGGMYWYPDAGTGPTAILNSTIADNTAGTQGGNVHVGGVGVHNAGISVKNTILDSGTPNNCSGTILSLGNNLESTDTCGLTAAGDTKNVSANLGPLQNNGGGTWTRALLWGSPAIDAGTNSGCPATDQRGVARAQGAACDIGSYEYRRAVLDIDDNGSCDALTDGLLAIRYLFGLTGTALTGHAIGAGAMRGDPGVVATYLSGIRAQLDVDGSGASDAATDGLLVLRYLFGLRGGALVAGVSLGSRNTATAVETYIQTLLP